MASVLVSTVSTHLREEEPQAFVDAVGRKNFLFNWFDKRMVSGGEGPRWRVNVTGSSAAGSYGEGDATPSPVVQTNVKASLAWKYSWVPLRFSRASLEQQANHSLIGDYYQQELEMCLRDLGDDIEAQLMSDGTGNSSKDITGLQAAISASGTYAGIARATYTNWQSYIASSVGTIAETDLATASQNLADTPRKSNWTHGLCGPAVFKFIANLFVSDRQIQVSQGDAMNGGGLVAAGGFTAVMYDGRPIIRVPGYTAQRLDLVQKDDFELRILRNFKIDDPVVEGDDIATKVTLGAQLVCAHSGRQGALTGITA